MKIESNLALIVSKKKKEESGREERISNDCWFGIFALQSTRTTVSLSVLNVVRPGLFCVLIRSVSCQRVSTMVLAPLLLLLCY